MNGRSSRIERFAAGEWEGAPSEGFCRAEGETEKQRDGHNGPRRSTQHTRNTGMSVCSHERWACAYYTQGGVYEGSGAGEDKG